MISLSGYVFFKRKATVFVSVFNYVIRLEMGSMPFIGIEPQNIFVKNMF